VPSKVKVMKKINCPTCDKKIKWDISNTFRPFCSERCKQIDLGAWANEQYSIHEPLITKKDSNKKSS
tara:strand:+ start:400 stop:600 length:201 start_codon:yes stop_codon:yes gene_type:complete